MTPKEQAQDLVEIMFLVDLSNPDEKTPMFYCNAKKCALIAVDLALSTCVESRIYYWIEVKHEIEKL